MENRKELIINEFKSLETKYQQANIDLWADLVEKWIKKDPSLKENDTFQKFINLHMPVSNGLKKAYELELQELRALLSEKDKVIARLLLESEQKDLVNKEYYLKIQGAA